MNSREFALIRAFSCYLGIEGSLLIFNCNDLFRLHYVVSVFIYLRIYLFVLPMAKVVAVREEILCLFAFDGELKGVFIEGGG